jgi:hypothetical protein
MSRTLIYDVENMAASGWYWPPGYETSIIRPIHDQHMLSIAYKWLGEKKTHCIALPDYKLYKTDKHNDKELAKDFWEVMDEADVVVGHNSNSFDNKMVNAMFIRHKLKPPSPYKEVDTMRTARKVGRFPSNKLDDLGDMLDIGRKKQHSGFDLWLGCDAGDPKSWKKMIDYNKQDVRLTEKLYLELRPWMANHPAVNVLDDRPEECPKGCGGKMIAGMKYKATSSNLYQYFRCNNCGSMAKARAPEKIEKPLYT